MGVEPELARLPCLELSARADTPCLRGLDTRIRLHTGNPHALATLYFVDDIGTDSQGKYADKTYKYPRRECMRRL